MSETKRKKNYYFGCLYLRINMRNNPVIIKPFFNNNLRRRFHITSQSSERNIPSNEPIGQNEQSEIRKFGVIDLGKPISPAAREAEFQRKIRSRKKMRPLSHSRYECHLKYFLYTYFI